MNDLNNTQLILLALLVSFVTSIATGIVTVTLLDQAPPVVTQTINRVVEKTVEVITLQEDTESEVVQTVVIKEEDFITKAAEKNSPNVVQLGILKKKFRIGGFGKPPKEEFELELLSTGFVLDNQFAVSQNYLFNDGEEPIIKTVDNHVYKVDVAVRDVVNNIMLLKIGDRVESAEDVMVNAEKTVPFTKIIFAKINDVQIGQTAIVLGLKNDVVLSLGVISQLEAKKGDDEDNSQKEVIAIHTTIDINEQYMGGPLINTNGEIVGINIIIEDGRQRTIPIHIVNSMIEQIEFVQAPEESEESP